MAAPRPQKVLPLADRVALTQLETQQHQHQPRLDSTSEHLSELDTPRMPTLNPLHSSSDDSTDAHFKKYFQPPPLVSSASTAHIPKAFLSSLPSWVPEGGPADITNFNQDTNSCCLALDCTCSLTRPFPSDAHSGESAALAKGDTRPALKESGDEDLIDAVSFIKEGASIFPGDLDAMDSESSPVINEFLYRIPEDCVDVVLPSSISFAPTISPKSLRASGVPRQSDDVHLGTGSLELPPLPPFAWSDSSASSSKDGSASDTLSVPPLTSSSESESSTRRSSVLSLLASSLFTQHTSATSGSGSVTPLTADDLASPTDRDRKISGTTETWAARYRKARSDSDSDSIRMRPFISPAPLINIIPPTPQADDHHSGMEYVQSRRLALAQMSQPVIGTGTGSATWAPRRSNYQARPAIPLPLPRNTHSQDAADWALTWSHFAPSVAGPHRGASRPPSQGVQRSPPTPSAAQRIHSFASLRNAMKSRSGFLVRIRSAVASRIGGENDKITTSVPAN